MTPRFRARFARRRRWAVAIAAAAACIGPITGPAAAAGPDFERDIQPILAEHCAHCHGIDESTRQGGLRLDIRQNALQGGDSGTPAIVPGKPAESEIVARIRSTDPDVIMPPPREKKPLSPEQMRLLEEWIAAGADYEPHWAFVAPKKATVPAVGAANPIDAFVHAHLAAKQIEPAPQADSATLCRRLYLDLVGLPPSPDDLTAYARDGHEKTVEKLLASPRYGEKWARHWLDLARYADTNGYEHDDFRQMWLWRDWVIAAINRDMPYDQFLVEQIAGDLLPDATQDQIVATGFLRNSMLNEEGAIIPEEFRMVEMFDRIDCVGKAALGLTTQCAQCHTHKFDPLTHEEYYGLFAFLNNSYEAKSYVYDAESLAQMAATREKLAAADEAIKTQRPNWRAEIAAWEREVAAGLVPWTPIVADEMFSGGLLTHPVQQPDKSVLMLGHRDNDIFMVATPPLQGATGLQIEALNHRDLLMGGPARDEFWRLDEVRVFLQQPGSEKWEAVKLTNATADFSNPERMEPVVDAEGKPKGDKKVSVGPVAALVDGVSQSAWESDRGKMLRHQPSVAVVQFEKPLDVPEGTKLKLQLTMWGTKPYAGDRQVLGCFRASLTTQPSPAAPPIDHAAVLAISKPAAERTPAESNAIFAAWRKTVADLAPVNDEIASLWASLPEPIMRDDLPRPDGYSPRATALHYAEREPARPRKTHLLDRGDWSRPLHEVKPHVPAALHPFPADAPPNRLGFAKWLVDPRSPLTARVAVNRFWQTLFGTGLVETPDDFGTRSPVPEYRDLLDWLAVDFQEKGYSQKEAIRQIVTSATYKQSSRATPEELARDPANRLLARGPRFRPDAEVVRDMALAISGLLTEKIGGPSVFPPVPQNMLALNFAPIPWPIAKGPDRYRRSLYVLRRRSMPDPVLSNFDAPAGEIACARRLRSNTPLAALAGLNEPVFVEAARALALRTLDEGGHDDASRGHYAFLLCTCRPPTDDELTELLAFVATQRKRLAEGWTNAREVATGDGEKLPGLPEGATPQDAAVWTLAARVLLNLDETLTKN
jgi:hypothetical protein